MKVATSTTNQPVSFIPFYAGAASSLKSFDGWFTHSHKSVNQQANDHLLRNHI